MVSFIFLILLSLTNLSKCRNKTLIRFSALSNLETNSGKSVVASQWLAIQEINKNPNLLADYELYLEAYDVEGDLGTALVKALEVIDSSHDTNNLTQLHFPIILGCPWSSLSSGTSPVFGAFDMGQISSGATSVALSNTDSYPQFYRTIPSDTLQAQGIVLLCQQFNWTRIAIVYVNDAYGLYLSIGILELAQNENIDATAIAFSADEESTIDQAAEQISTLDVYIIVLIVHENILKTAFQKFENAGLFGYPYLYIGVDSWFDTPIIQHNDVQNYTEGFIGTIPWQTNSLDLSEYNEDPDLKAIINESLIKFTELDRLWNEYYNNGYQSELYDIQQFASLAIYGYDAFYTLAETLDEYMNTLDANQFNDLFIDGFNITLINELILSRDFIGTSGHVIFDSNGDRGDGLYGLGNVQNGTVHYFGYFTDDDGELKIKVDYDQIKWPKYFDDNDIEPRSNLLTTDRVQTISLFVSVPLLILSSISVIIAVMFILLTLKYHNSAVLRAASWKINLIMCVGGIFGYITMIVYGIDERQVSVGPAFTFLCNARLWWWTMAYTLLYMPLFVKTYRLSRIFATVLQKQYLQDTKLLYVVLICVGVDVFLLTIYTAIEPLTRIYLSGFYEQIDELQNIHYLYGSCETSSDTKTLSFAFYGLISLWKIIESLFGIYCALAVSRVGNKKILQFDETSQQLYSILFTILALCIAIPLLAFGPRTIPSFYYAVIGCLTISVGNVTISLNLFPRLYALVKGGDALLRYSQSPEEKMEDLVIQQLKKVGIDAKWWKKASTVERTTEIYRSNSKIKDNKNASRSIIKSSSDRLSITGNMTAADFSSVKTNSTKVNSADSGNVQLTVYNRQVTNSVKSNQSLGADDYIDEQDEQHTDSDIAEQRELGKNRKQHQLIEHIGLNNDDDNDDNNDKTDDI